MVEAAEAVVVAESAMSNQDSTYGDHEHQASLANEIREMDSKQK